MTTIQEAARDSSISADTCAILVVAALGLMLRILFCNGPLGSDDTNYFVASREILFDWHISTVHHHSSRLVLLLLAGIPGAAAGDIYVSCIANIVYSVAADLVVVWAAHRILGSRPALLCAIVLLLNGLLMSYSGTLLPEPLLTMFAFLGVWIFRKAVDADLPAASRLAVFSGLLCGLSYSVKDTGILVPPLLVAYLALFHLRQQGISRVFVLSTCCFIGFVSMVLLECSSLWLLTDDFAYKYHALSLTHNGVVEPASGLVDFFRRGSWNFSQLPHDPLALGVPAAAFVGAWIWCLLRSSAVRIFAFVGLGMGIYLLFGTSSFSRLMNLPFQERYATLVFPFGAICLASCAGKWLTREKVGGLATAGLALICLWAGVATSAERAGTLYFTASIRNAVLAVESVPEARGRIAVPDFLCRQLQRTAPAALKDRLVCLPRDATRVHEDMRVLLLPKGGAMQTVDVISRHDGPPENEGWVLHSVHRSGQKNIDRLLGLGRNGGTSQALIYTR